MNTELTEEEMRQALFGEPQPPAPVINAHIQETAPDVALLRPLEEAKNKKVSKAVTPRLRVTLRVGNEFEGKIHEIVHEANMLSSLVAEQEATKIARKNLGLWKWCRSSQRNRGLIQNHSCCISHLISQFGREIFQVGINTMPNSKTSNLTDRESAKKTAATGPFLTMA